MTTTDTIRVLLVDDHALVREGLRAVLSTKKGLKVVGEASSGAQGIAMSKELHPDIVLMDITMAGMSGIEATAIITRLEPEVRVLGLTVHENPEYFSRMLAAGASGYVLKGATSDELVAAIRSVGVGGVYISAGIAGYLERACTRNLDPEPKKAEDGLTARESEVLELLAKGLTNQAIAARLNLSVSTVQSHRANIIRKLGLESGQQLILYALRKGNAPGAT